MDAVTEEKFKNIEEKIDTLIVSQKHSNEVIEEVRDLEAENANKVAWLKTVVDEHHNLFWNKGKDGVMQRLDRVEQQAKAGKERRTERIYLWLSLASLLVTILVAIYHNH